MRPRLLADANFRRAVLSGLLVREPTLDIVNADQASLRGVNDKGVLEYASIENRILVTHDKRTMPRHFAEHLLLSNSPGVVIVSTKLPTFLIIEGLLLFCLASQHEEWHNTIITLPT